MKQIEIDGVGPVLLEHSQRARRLVLSVRADRGVRVAVPRECSFREAENFARRKSPWIRTCLDHLRRAAQHHESLCLAPADEPGAREKLSGKIGELAARHGFTFGRLSFRNQRTRWGSCSVRNDISLNLKLACLPDDLIDYVLLHELLHTRVKNHSPAFWKEMDKLVRNAQGARGRLRDYRLGLL